MTLLTQLNSDTGLLHLNRGNTCAIFQELGKIFSDNDLLKKKYNGFTPECTVDFKIL